MGVVNNILLAMEFSAVPMKGQNQQNKIFLDCLSNKTPPLHPGWQQDLILLSLLIQYFNLVWVHRGV